jgi:hypothetical protein
LEVEVDGSQKGECCCYIRCRSGKEASFSNGTEEACFFLVRFPEERVTECWLTGESHNKSKGEMVVNHSYILGESIEVLVFKTSPGSPKLPRCDGTKICRGKKR